MTAKELKGLLKRYEEGRCTEREKEQVEAWFERINVSTGNDDKRSLSEMREQIWANIARKTQRTVSPWLRVAAALVLVAAGAIIFNQYYHTSTTESAQLAEIKPSMQIQVASTEPRRIILPDNSIINLQPGSEIRYPEIFGEQREVFLTGEAFFEVARDVQKPFFVYTNEVTTRVLGTSFLIKAITDEKEILVSVRTGKVSVYTQNTSNGESAPEIVLTPNQTLVYNRNEHILVKKLAEDPHVVATQPVRPSYVNTPVANIFQALQLNYGIEISYDTEALSACTLTAEDIAEEGLYEQIEIICNAIGAEYTFSDFSIVISSKGCH